jgi:HK97 family phage major capsid protein
MATKELLDKLEEIGELNQAFQERHAKELEKVAERANALQERIEMLEGAASRPRLSTGRESKDYRVLHTASAPAYVVSSKGRLADIPELNTKQPEISLDRWCRALVFGSACEDKEALQFLGDQKSVTTSTTGALVPAAYAPMWIDMARAQSALIRAGTRTVVMNDQTLTYSHQTSDPTFSWRSSEGASLSATDPGFASRVLTAKTVAVRTQVSLEASMDIPDFGAQIAGAYTRAFGAAIDAAGIKGVSPAPTGLLTTSGVGTVTSVGTPTNWDEVLDGAAAFLNANNSLDELTGIIMHPNIWRVYAGLKTGISSDQTPLQMPPAIANVPQFVTTNADDVTSPLDYHVVLGNFNDLIMGVRLNPTIRILDGTTSMASNLIVEIVGVARIDFLATRPASFVVLSGVTP